MIHDSRRRSLEMAHFLRSRRAALQPTNDERRAQPRRRVTGLTRAEIAARAGVSVTWYSWLEMGRDIHATPGTLASIARALQLNADETSYLLTLAAEPHNGEASRRSEIPNDVLVALVDGYSSAPAFVVDRRWSVVASNTTARRIYGFTPSNELHQNVLWRLVHDPALRELHRDADAMMESVAAIVRYNFADDPENPELVELIGGLRGDERFRKAWDRYGVRTFSPFRTEIQWNGQTLRFHFVALAAGYRGRETFVVHLPLDEKTLVALAC